MHSLKHSIWYSMTSPANLKKKQYLDENEARIDMNPAEEPPCLPQNHPLTRDLSIKKILYQMQNDVIKLEEEKYESFLNTMGKQGANQSVNESIGYGKTALGGSLVQMKGKSAMKVEGMYNSAHAPPHLPPLKTGGKSKPTHTLKASMDSSILQQHLEKKPEPINYGILGRYVRNPKDLAYKNEGAEGVVPSANTGARDSNAADQEESTRMKRNYSVPSLKRKDQPTRRIDREFKMFKEIFVAPREMKLEELQKKDHLELLENAFIKKVFKEMKEQKEKVKNFKNVELNHSNMINESQHEIRNATTKAYLKKSPLKLKSEQKKRKLKIHETIKKDLITDPAIKEMLLEEDDSTQDMYAFNKQEEDPLDEVINIVIKKFNSKIKSRGGDSFFAQQIQVTS